MSDASLKSVPVIFKIGKEEFGVEISAVHGIERAGCIYDWKAASPYLDGEIEVRGKRIPIYHLKERFGIPADNGPELEKVFIILEYDDLELALLVDTVEEINMEMEKEILAVPEVVRTPNNTYYEKIIQTNGKLIMILDISKILTDSEKELLRAKRQEDERKE